MAEWKKVLLKGDNLTDEQVLVTDAEINVGADSIVFADADASPVANTLHRESVADFATKLAGTNTATGLKAASGVLGLDKDTPAITSLASGDIILAYDIDEGVWGATTANVVGSAGGNTDSQYSVEAEDTSNTSATIKLVGAGTAAGTDDTVVISAGGELTIDTNEGSDTISLGTNTAIESFVSVYNNSLKVGRDANDHIDFSSDAQITMKVNNTNDDAVVLNGTAFQPVNDSKLELGVTGKRWVTGWFDKAVVDDIDINGTTIQHVNGAGTLLTLNGTASVATKVDTTNVSDAHDHHLLFVNADDSSNQGAETATNLIYNPSTENLGSASTNFLGNAATATDAENATTATTGNKIKINDADDTNGTYYFLFSDSHGGNSQDVYADSSFHWNPSNETLTVTNLQVSGTSTTVNTTDLNVSDSTILISSGSASPGDANGAGIMVDAGDSVTNPTHMPEFKWNNGGALTGWTVSNYNAAGATDFPVAVMSTGDGAPSGSGAGSGSFYVDTNSSNLDLYVYI